MALSSEIPQELKDLLSWNPPQLYPRLLPAKTMSTKTSEPTFFDRHVSERLKLLHVKRLPTLVHDIAAIVDGITANGVQFPSSLFYSAAIFNHLVNRLDCTVVDENEVASFYDKTTATFCIQAASILALGVPNLLRWSLLGNVSGHAIADGFLYFADPTTSAGVYAKLEVIMGKEIADLVRLLAKRRSALTTQEFKNLAAGERDVMLAIPRLSTLPKFNWNNCDVPDCAMMTSHENNRVVEVEAIMGHDAKTTPWTFPRHSNNSMFPGVQGSSENVATSKGLKRKRDEDSGDKGRANLSLAPKASYAPVIPLLTTPQGHGPRRSARVAARVQNPDGGTNVTQSIPPPLLPVGVVQVAKGKEMAQDEDGDDGDGNSEDADNKLNPSYKDNHDLSALNIVQQAWAQATREDNSIIVLQSGNHEFIGIRHRASQTLYVSDLIEPHACREPSYGKLHLGIYIAAVSDAIERASQGAASGDGPSGGMRGGGPSDGRDNHNGSTRSSGSVMLRAAHETTKSTLELASGRNVMLLYLQYDIYNSPAPSTFVRSDPTGQAPILPSQETVRNCQLEECLTIVLTSEIDCGANGEVLRGTLEVEAEESALLDVVVKLALASEQRDALRKEYHIYHLLEKSAVTTGITTPLGLFEDVEGSACALVMPYVGIPLAKMPDFHLPISHRDAILATLKKIHQAGILHHDLSLNNILVADSGLTIIDFGQSQVCHDQGKKNHEYLQLQSLLVQYAKQSRQKKS